jgi:hypothetical protein
MWKLIPAALIAFVALSAKPAAALPVSIRVKNESQMPVIVVMDTEREVHRIGAGAADTFHPNVGDNPTYRVYECDAQGNRGRRLWSESFSTVWVGGFPPTPHVGGDLKWTEGKLERD